MTFPVYVPPSAPRAISTRSHLLHSSESNRKVGCGLDGRRESSVSVIALRWFAAVWLVAMEGLGDLLGCGVPVVGGAAFAASAFRSHTDNRSIAVSTSRL